MYGPRLTPTAIDGVHPDHHHRRPNHATLSKPAKSTPTVVDDNCFGGAQLLAQFSHLRSACDNTTAIYSAALNMAFDSRTDSLYHAANNGRVEIQSIIGNGYNSSNAITMRVHNPGDQAVRMVVPQGTMVEQQTWTGKQNLVVNDDVGIDIEPGQTGAFLACLRQRQRRYPQR